jgi:hypothetical protein
MIGGVKEKAGPGCVVQDNRRIRSPAVSPSDTAALPPQVYMSKLMINLLQRSTSSVPYSCYSEATIIATHVVRFVSRPVFAGCMHNVSKRLSLSTRLICRFHVAMRQAILLVLATAGVAQSSGPRDNSSAKVVDITNRLCNSSILDANASGIITHEHGDLYDTAYRSGVPDHSWAVTITGGSGQALERQFWYDTAGQNYGDDVGIDTDVCAIPNFHLPLNAHRLGQDDPGNCSTVFSQHCIDSVTSMASESALKWTTYSSPPPYENLTAGVLPSICTYIANDLQETIKRECGSQMRADSGVTANFDNALGE